MSKGVRGLQAHVSLRFGGLGHCFQHAGVCRQAGLGMKNLTSYTLKPNSHTRNHQPEMLIRLGRFRVEALSREFSTNVPTAWDSSVRGSALSVHEGM